MCFCSYFYRKETQVVLNLKLNLEKSEARVLKKVVVQKKRVFSSQWASSVSNENKSETIFQNRNIKFEEKKQQR